MVAVTAAAAAEIQSALREKGLDGFGLRVQIVGGGCEGFVYDLLYVDEPESDDQVFESEGLRLFVDPKSHRAVDGLLIDHAKTPYGTGFVFTNPRATSRCSCGASFAL